MKLFIENNIDDKLIIDNNLCDDFFAELKSVTDVVMERNLDHKGLPDMFVNIGNVKLDGG